MVARLPYTPLATGQGLTPAVVTAKQLVSWNVITMSGPPQVEEEADRLDAEQVDEDHRCGDALLGLLSWDYKLPVKSLGRAHTARERELIFLRGRDAFTRQPPCPNVFARD